MRTRKVAGLLLGAALAAASLGLATAPAAQAATARAGVNPQPGIFYEVFTPYISGGDVPKCLDDPHGSGTNGQALVIFSCHSGTNQLWLFSLVPGTSNVYRIVNKQSGLCLGVPTTTGAPGTLLEQVSCDDGGFTEWEANSPFETDHFNLISVQFPSECAVASNASDSPNASTSVRIDICDPGTALFQNNVQTWALG